MRLCNIKRYPMMEGMIMRLFPRLLLLAAVQVALTVVPAWADEQSGDLKPVGEKLGTVRFPTSCTPAAQRQFERAVALLHSFWFSESNKAFAAIAQTDPSCGMAHWGSAVTLFGNPFTWPLTGKALTDGWAAVERAKAAGAKTAREQDYIAAVEAFYKDADKIDHRTRALAYERAMEQVAKRYPDDTEASIFYALALNTTALASDKTYANQLKAAAILEEVFKDQPNHPGAAHYLVHSYDYPPIAEKGLPAARRYADVAPSAPHALHMPSHIFTRRGFWQDSIESNLKSKNSTDNHFDRLHALDYLVYAYLQTGQDDKASAVRDEVEALKKVNSESFPTAFALAAIPARFALERARWSEAAKLALHPSELDYPWASFPHAEAVLTFARAIGAARSGDVTAARSDIATLKTLKENLVQAKNNYWSEQVEIQIQAASALAAFAEGKKEEGLALMRTAANMEDATEKHPVVPGPLIPARELLGDMLLELQLPAQALKEFEASAQREPNRLRGYYGAARAAEMSNDKHKAAAYYAKLAELAKGADSDRPEIRQAKAYLAKN